MRYPLSQPIPNNSLPVVESAATSVLQEPEQEQVDFGVPLRLKIPQINVDAHVEAVGLAAGGDMAAPSGNHNVGWYKSGPNPGNTGSAVIDGHYGRTGKSVFGKLGELKKGDKVYVEDDRGMTSVFVVRASRSFDPELDTPEVFDSSDGKSYLNLITCEGVWDSGSNSFSKRLVVFADKE